MSDEDRLARIRITLATMLYEGFDPPYNDNPYSHRGIFCSPGRNQRANAGAVSLRSGFPRRQFDFALMTEQSNKCFEGLVRGTGLGRTDMVHLKVVAGAYCVPSDVVSALGDGNSLAGADKLSSMFMLRIHRPTLMSATCLLLVANILSGPTSLPYTFASHWPRRMTIQWTASSSKHGEPILRH